MAYWLLKSEPTVYGIDHLMGEPDLTTAWDGVRNFQARNFIRSMTVGDQAFFYHSNCEEPGIVGVVEIAREAYPDATAFDPQSRYYDPRGSVAEPRWFAVDVRFVRKLSRTLTLAQMKADPALAELPLVRRGNRLSVMPVTSAQWQHLLSSC